MPHNTSDNTSAEVIQPSEKQTPLPNATVDNSSMYAAVDLGSNSFHIVISRYQHGEFVVVDRHRETVRLASGLNDENELSDEVAVRALDCLQKFSQLLLSVPEDNIRAVGTNALRRMRDGHKFLEKAESMLNHPIEIIAGREEARLIYLGVVKGSEFGDSSRVVVDIGGGSTEVIVGNSDEPAHRESLEMGCVVVSNKFFADGILSEDRFEQAILYSELAIQPVVKLFKQQGWQHVIGCSGTIKSLSNILDAMGWANGEITLSALRKLYDYVLKEGSVSGLQLPGLTDDRKPVFAGGLSILIALFELFSFERMQVSDVALREGVLYDLIGRTADSDVRDVALNALLQRCAVDVHHAEYVKNTALRLYDDVSTTWDIDVRLLRKMLGWSALVHEIGMLISHDAYHKHGAYLVQNADLVGFARRDQMLLACMIRGHRRKFPVQDFEKLPASIVTPAKRLAILLRLAVLLHRARSEPLPEGLSSSASGMQLTLSFPDGWLAAHPLTSADLQQEKKWLKAIGLDLRF